MKLYKIKLPDILDGELKVEPLEVIKETEKQVTYKGGGRMNYTIRKSEINYSVSSFYSVSVIADDFELGRKSLLDFIDCKNEKLLRELKLDETRRKRLVDFKLEGV
jgi:hypothetical protein